MFYQIISRITILQHYIYCINQTRLFLLYKLWFSNTSEFFEKNYLYTDKYNINTRQIIISYNNDFEFDDIALLSKTLVLP